MSRIYRALFPVAFSFLLLAMGCAGPQQQAPTPFPTAGTPQNTPVVGPTTLTLQEVADSLGLYEDALIVVSGRLKRQPLFVCDSEPHPSPATWALTDDGAALLAGEFDQQVRQLLPEDITMTVEGRLRRWNGPVGCGKQAQPQEVWFLEASRILSPSPLTQATLTPTGFDEGSTDITQVTPTEMTSDTQPTLEPTIESLEPVPTPDEAIETPQVQQTVEATETVPTPEDTSLVTPEAPTEGTLTAGTATVTPGVGTPSATPPTANGTATATSGPGQVVDKGDVYDVDGEFPAATLGPGEIHSWTLELSEDEIYDVKVIAPIPADIVLSFYRDGQPLVDRQNTAPAGTAEVLAIRDQPIGDYEIRVQTEAGRSTEYIMLLSTPIDYELSSLGFLASGAPRANINMSEGEYHYWNFTAAAGNRITVTVTPGSDTSPFLTLFGPDGVEIDGAGDGEPGEPVVFEYTIEQDGLHTLSLEEYSAAEMTYTITLSIQP